MLWKKIFEKEKRCYERRDVLYLLGEIEARLDLIEKKIQRGETKGAILEIRELKGEIR
jgi:hypothetical protein